MAARPRSTRLSGRRHRTRNAPVFSLDHARPPRLGNGREYRRRQDPADQFDVIEERQNADEQFKRLANRYTARLEMVKSRPGGYHQDVWDRRAAAGYHDMAWWIRAVARFHARAAAFTGTGRVRSAARPHPAGRPLAGHTALGKTSRGRRIPAVRAREVRAMTYHIRNILTDQRASPDFDLPYKHVASACAVLNRLPGACGAYGVYDGKGIRVHGESHAPPDAPAGRGRAPAAANKVTRDGQDIEL